MTDTPTGDYLVRAMAERGLVRVLAVRSTGVGRALLEAHQPYPTAAAALIRVSTAALLMGGTIKGREQLSIQLRGDGPLGELLAIADAHGHVRATVHQPFTDMPPRDDGKFNVADAIGQGTLTVTKNLGMREPYHGVVPIVDGGVAMDLAHYYVTSEQKPTVMALGELLEVDDVTSAGGFLLQLFPGHPEPMIDLIEARISEMPPVSAMLSEGLSPEDMLREIFPDVTILETYPVALDCTCSRERYEGILVTLGEEELRAIIEEGDDTELRCHFCNTVYTYDQNAMRHILAQARGGIN